MIAGPTLNYIMDDSAFIDLDAPVGAPSRVVARSGLTRREALRGALAAAATLVVVGYSMANIAATTAPEPATSPPKAWGSFASRVPGTELYLMIAVDTTGKLIGHVCDGGMTAAWFTGSAAENMIDLSTGAARLIATTEPARVTGTLTLRGASHSFVLTSVTDSGGLYVARATAAGVTHTAAWIVLADGTQRGTLQTGDMTSSAPTLNPAQASLTTDSGISLLPKRLDQYGKKWGRFTRDSTRFVDSKTNVSLRDAHRWQVELAQDLDIDG